MEVLVDSLGLALPFLIGGGLLLVAVTLRHRLAKNNRGQRRRDLRGTWFLRGWSLLVLGLGLLGVVEVLAGRFDHRDLLGHSVTYSVYVLVGLLAVRRNWRRPSGEWDGAQAKRGAIVPRSTVARHSLLTSRLSVPREHLRLGGRAGRSEVVAGCARRDI